MSTKRFWFGFLEAGERSSAVLRDDTLKTGNPETAYIFNLQRKEILEYKLDIVQPRLKELDDESTISELTAAYAVCKKDFKPRNQTTSTPEVAPAEKASKVEPEKSEELVDLASNIADGEEHDMWDEDE